MPKRIATPPPGDDEPRYLTVVHPYAISGTCNMELPKDRQDFARWVACCVDKDAFFAIYHKPKSRGMVIIEINRSYQYFDRILGEHRWSEFLQNPTDEEAGKLTRVFYCTYNTGRIVQKNGWKRIDVDDTWFKAWSPRNRHITFPYPMPHFCDVPKEDRTNHSMCRPLPSAVITPPPVIVAPQPVVGSAAWTEKKEGGVASTTSNAWAKGAPKAISPKPNPAANGTVKKTVGVPAPRQPAVGGGSVTVKSSIVWQHTGKKAASTPVAQNWDEPAPVSRQGTPLSPAFSPVGDNQPPLMQPGLPARSAWGVGATSRPTLPPGLTTRSAPDRTINFSTGSWGSAGASTSSPESDSGPDLTTATESDNPYAVHIHFSESMEEEFHGMRIRAIEDEGGLRELDAIAPGNWDEPNVDEAWETTAAMGWDDDALDAADHWKQTQPQLQESVNPILCNAHGIICKKGICAEYAKQLRFAKRAEEAEKRKATTGANKEKKGRFKGRGAGKNGGIDGENGNGNGNRAADKSAQNNQFRGPGAPVKTNWRGAPRAIVTADSMEKRETTKADGSDGWDNSDWEDAPNVTAVVPATENTSADATSADATSNASWDISENTYDPWATTTPAQSAPKTSQPTTSASGGNNKLQGKKNAKAAQTKAPLSSSWADQVEAELATGADGGLSSVATSKRGKKRGTSTASRGSGTKPSTAKSSTSGWGSGNNTSAATSSTGGWGSVANQDLPW